MFAVDVKSIYYIAMLQQKRIRLIPLPKLAIADGARSMRGDIEPLSSSLFAEMDQSRHELELRQHLEIALDRFACGSIDRELGVCL